MSDKTGFFEERPGVKSWTRLAMSVLILSGVIIAFVDIIANVIDPVREIHTALIGELAGMGVAGKVTQKILAEKTNKNELNTK